MDVAGGAEVTGPRLYTYIYMGGKCDMSVGAERAAAECVSHALVSGWITDFSDFVIRRLGPGNSKLVYKLSRRPPEFFAYAPSWHIKYKRQG